MQTKVITYNLRERGRQYRGKERNFNLRAIASAINSPACQERVRNRDMLGFYGHWPRVKFGMNPREGGLDGGRPALVEPALVTTFLRASDDGTVEHQAEFIDNDSGKVAAKLYNGRIGGFSSAIDQIGNQFWGFDYVLEPNYTTNRGYTLDDVNDMTLDDVEAAMFNEQLLGLSMLLDSAHAEREQASEVIERLQVENEQLLSMLASKGIEAGQVLDSVGVAPLVVSMDSHDRLRRDADFFRQASLPRIAIPAPEGKPVHPLPGRLLNRFSR